MNRTTFLSTHFPDFVEKWNKYYHNFKQVNYWCISSDYCLDDKKKPNDVMTFTIFPFDNSYFIKENIRQHLHKDIKEFQNLSEDVIKYIKESPYFFSIALIIKNKNKIFDIEGAKKRLDDLIEYIKTWPEPKKEEFIHKIKKLRNYLDRKDVKLKFLSNISITVYIMSEIIEFLLLKTNMKHVVWISDRDGIINFQDGVVHELIRIGYANLVRNRVSDNKVYTVLEDKQYNKDLLDDFIRIPDHISGAIASMYFKDVDRVPEKHYNLFDKSIVDNERIYVIHLEHDNDVDILSNVIFMREKK